MCVISVKVCVNESIAIPVLAILCDRSVASYILTIHPFRICTSLHVFWTIATHVGSIGMSWCNNHSRDSNSSSSEDFEHDVRMKWNVWENKWELLFSDWCPTQWLWCLACFQFSDLDFQSLTVQILSDFSQVGETCVHDVFGLCAYTTRTL